MKYKYPLVTVLIVYILSLSFQTQLFLPVFEYRVQVPELVFLCVIVVFGSSLRPFQFRFNFLDYAVGIYLLFNILSVITSGPNTTSLLEILGRAYLVLVYVVVKNIVSTLQKEDIDKYVYRPIIFLGVVTSLIAIAGWGIASYSGADNATAFLHVNYPYFDSIYRARGFTASPTMLSNLLSVPLFIVVSRLVVTEVDKKLWLMTGIILLSSLLTFSKSLLLIIAGIFLIFLSSKKKKLKALKSAVVLTTIIIYCVITHLLIFSSNSNWKDKLMDAPFTSNQILFDNGEMLILESFYLFSKRCALKVSQEHLLLGVGPGNFFNVVSAVNENQVSGLRKFRNFDPHSAYFGGLAETGILGLLSIGLLFYLSLRMSKRLVNGIQEYVSIGLLASLVFFFISGITTDIMNMRILWVVLGVVSGLYDIGSNGKMGRHNITR